MPGSIRAPVLRWATSRRRNGLSTLVGSFSERAAEKAWDPLSARALVLDDGQTRLAIVIVDSCLIPRSLFDEVKQRASKATGIRTDHMLMAATHTHSAPASLDRLFAKASDEYLEVLKQGIVEAVKQANANLEPAEIGWGQVDVPDTFTTGVGT